MIVVLNDTLEEVPLSERAIEWAQEKVVKDLFQQAKKKGFNRCVTETLDDPRTKGAPEFKTLGFMGMLSKAYSNHLPVAVAPHDFWFIANCELAAIIGKDAEHFRAVFSSQESGKEELVIGTNDPERIDYNALIDVLEKKIPNKEMNDLLIPDLTTVDKKVFDALCATLADVCQHYYSYSTFCCGIPKVRVLGSEGDYRKLASGARRLAEIFEFSLEALTYYDRIAGLFDRMADTFVRGPEESDEFWRSIFTQKNVGSGGQLEIDGWIRDFFSKRPTQLENFGTAIASVPYRSLNTEKDYLGLTGAFAAVQDEDGFWHTDFREVVFTKVPKEDEEPEEVSYGFNHETGEKTIRYSNGTTKVVQFAQPSNKVPAISQKRAEEVSKWTLQELPAVSIHAPQARGLVSQGDTYEEAIAYAFEVLMRAEDSHSKNPEINAGVIRGPKIEDIIRWPKVSFKKDEKK